MVGGLEKHNYSKMIKVGKVTAVQSNFPKRILINYADSAYKKTQRWNSWTGKHVAGFDAVFEFGPTDIDEDFQKRHSNILQIKRGAGLWLWKPYVIHKTLKTMAEGDYLFYCDAGAFFIRRIDDLIHAMGNESIWVSEIPLIEKNWTKPSMLEKMDACDPVITDTRQIQGTFVLIKKNEESVKFVEKWLETCCDMDLLAPMSDTEPHGECISHREDQSVLSVLCKKMGIRTYKDPTQFGRLPQKYKRAGALFEPKKYCGTQDYKPIIILHRTKDVNCNICFRQWLCAILPMKIVNKLVRR